MEAEKTTVVPTIIAVDKHKEQDKISRTREEVATQREQIHLVHDQVNTAFGGVKFTGGSFFFLLSLSFSLPHSYQCAVLCAL